MLFNLKGNKKDGVPQITMTHHNSNHTVTIFLLYCYIVKFDIIYKIFLHFSSKYRHKMLVLSFI